MVGQSFNPYPPLNSDPYNQLLQAPLPGNPFPAIQQQPVISSAQLHAVVYQPDLQISTSLGLASPNNPYQLNALQQHNPESNLIQSSFPDGSNFVGGFGSNQAWQGGSGGLAGQVNNQGGPYQPVYDTSNGAASNNQVLPAGRTLL